MSKVPFPTLTREGQSGSGSGDPMLIRIIGGWAIKQETQRSLLDTTDQRGEHALWRPGLDRDIADDLRNSVVSLGVFAPILIVKDTDGTPVCVDGASRLRAARESNAARVAKGLPARLVPYRSEADVGQRGETIVMAANYNRKVMSTGELLDDVTEKCAKGWTVETVALATGKTQNYIRQLLRLEKELSKKVLASLRADKITLTAALELAKLPEDKQGEALEAVESAPAGRSGSGGAKAAKAARAKAEGQEVSTVPGKKVIKALLAAPTFKQKIARDALKWVLTGEQADWIRDELAKAESARGAAVAAEAKSEG